MTFLAFAIGLVSVMGQNRTTLIQRINDIKSQSETYFWDQYTCPDADSAKVNATKRLLLDVNRGRSEYECLTFEEVMPRASYINIDRGNLKQYFVYIKKSDAAAIRGTGASVSEVSVPTVSVPVSPVVQKSFVPDAFVQRIVETKDFTNVYKLLKALQTQGQVLQFGKLKDVEDYSSLDLILFDMQSQQIVTMLSPVNASGYRTNLVDGREDTLDNYPTNMTAVIWYIKK